MSPTTPNDLPAWDRHWEDHVYSHGRQLNRYPYDVVVSLCGRRFPSSLDRSSIRVLELGFGAGNNLWFAAREGFAIAGIEGSPSAVSYATERLRSDGLEGDLRRGDFTDLPWADETFDLVIDRESLTQSRGRRAFARALDEGRRVLKPGGWLLSLVYSSSHPDIVHGTLAVDGTYEFERGRFAHLGTTQFLSREEVVDLYGTRFRLVALTHRTEENALAVPPVPSHALWIIECRAE